MIPKSLSFGLGPLPQYPLGDWRTLAPRIEQLGFDALWIPDERFYRDVVATLATIASMTSQIDIGTSVTDPYIRHPALAAQWTASIDELSSGRMNIGIGAGIAGFSALGIQRVRPVRAINEMVELMRQLWGAGTVNFQGELFSFNEAKMDFTPLRKRIPCFIAGRGPLILKLAGKIGDGVIIGSLAAEESLRYAFKQIDEGLKFSERTREDLDVAIWLHTAVSKDQEKARQAVREIIVGILISSRPILDRLGVPISKSITDALENLRYVHGSADVARTAEMLSDELIDSFSVAGSPDYLAERIKELHASGINHFALKPWMVPGQSFEEFAQVISEEVMPKVR